MRAIRIFALGERNPEFLTHREVDAAFGLLPERVRAEWVATDSPRARELSAADGIWLLPGSPYRDDEVAFAAIRHCLDTGTPFLGTCGGFQYAAIELSRRLAGVPRPAHAETEPAAEDPVIVALACSLYGERRLVEPKAGTRLAAACGSEPFEGFHFCGYGLETGHARRLERAGVTISAWAEDAGPEGLELDEHPFFLATAFQPQVGSASSGVLHPLIAAFVAAVEAQAA